jgi:hypothetical protein
VCGIRPVIAIPTVAAEENNCNQELARLLLEDNDNQNLPNLANLASSRSAVKTASEKDRDEALVDTNMMPLGVSLNSLKVYLMVAF